MITVMDMLEFKRFASRELPAIIDRIYAALKASVKANPATYAMGVALAGLFLASAVAAWFALPSQGGLEDRVERLERAVFGGEGHEVHAGGRRPL